MIKNNFFLLFVLNVSFILSIHAQDKRKPLPLKEVLALITTQDHVNFDLIEDEIDPFKIIPPLETISLKEKLAYISKKTQLQFKFISSNYISVIHKKKLNKLVHGYLINSETNQPINNAIIQVDNSGNNCFSNEKGYFEINTKLSNNLIISHLNYEKIFLKSDELDPEHSMEIKMKPVLNELNEVFTQVFMTKGISRKIDGSFELKPKKFGLLPGLTEPDVFQTIIQLLGIQNIDENISNISVRGGTHDQNLFLWNGIRLFQTSHFFGLISALNPSLAHTVTISKNGSSAFTGESVSSVIDISSHSNSIENGQSSIGATMINGEFYSKIKTSKTSNFEISARRSLTDFLNTPTYKSYYNRIFQNTIVTDLTNNQIQNYQNDVNFVFYDATAQFQKKINLKNEIFVDFIAISNQLDIDQSKIENDVRIPKKSCIGQQTLGGSILYKTNWNEKNKTEINSYISYYNISSENEAIISNQIFNQKNTVLDIGLKIQNSHQLSDRFTFRNGYQFNEIDIENFDVINSPTFSRKIKNVIRTHVFIAEVSYSSKNNKLKSTFGIRQNYIEQFDKFIFEPRIQFNYALNNKFKIELLAEKKSQTNSQIVDLQQDFLGLEKKRWVLSNNNNIPVIKSKQLSLGLIYASNSWLLTLDNFYKKVTGITSMSQGFQNQLEFEKLIGDYTVFGSEILIQKKINNFTSWLSYSYSKNNYNFNNYIPRSFPNNFEIIHSLSFATIYDYKNLKIALGAKWFSGKPVTIPSTNTAVLNSSQVPEISYLNPNSSKTGNYFQVNFSSGYTIKWNTKSQLQFGFAVQNVLNKKNIINQQFRINGNTNDVEKINTYSLELTPNAFLKYKF